MGFQPVNSAIFCVMTRFHLRSSWWLLPSYLAYRRIQRDSRQIPGLLRSAFLVEDARTYYTFSLWRDRRAMYEFNTRVRAHIDAANRSFGRTWNPRLRRAEIWSVSFALAGVSESNLVWEGFDLREILKAQKDADASLFGGAVRV